MTAIAGFIVGLFALMVWLEYDGSLVDDVARWLKRHLRRNHEH